MLNKKSYIVLLLNLVLNQSLQVIFSYQIVFNFNFLIFLPSVSICRKNIKRRKKYFSPKNPKKKKRKELWIMTCEQRPPAAICVKVKGAWATHPRNSPLSTYVFMDIFMPSKSTFTFHEIFSTTIVLRWTFLICVGCVCIAVGRFPFVRCTFLLCLSMNMTSVSD